MFRPVFESQPLNSCVQDKISNRFTCGVALMEFIHIRHVRCTESERYVPPLSPPYQSFVIRTDASWCAPTLHVALRVSYPDPRTQSCGRITSSENHAERVHLSELDFYLPWFEHQSLCLRESRVKWRLMMGLHFLQSCNRLYHSLNVILYCVYMGQFPRK